MRILSFMLVLLFGTIRNDAYDVLYRFDYRNDAPTAFTVQFLCIFM